MPLQISILGGCKIAVRLGAFKRAFFCVGPRVIQKTPLSGRAIRTGLKFANVRFLTRVNSGVSIKSVFMSCGEIAVGM